MVSISYGNKSKYSKCGIKMRCRIAKQIYERVGVSGA